MKTKQFNQDQLAFNFDAPQVRKSDPVTSKKAILGMNFGKKRLDVLHALETFKNGAATFEVAALMNVPRDHISSHIKPLRLHGWIIDTGLVKINPATGKKCIIYAVTNKYVMSSLYKGSSNKYYSMQLATNHICKCGVCGRII